MRIRSFCNLLFLSVAMSAFSQNVHQGHKYVDLGLSVNWATTNVGATSPEKDGEYYRFAETTPFVVGAPSKDWKYYKEQTIPAHKDADGYDVPAKKASGYTKYTSKALAFSDSNADDKVSLDPSDDVVTLKWKGQWRTPTPDELDELWRNCNIEEKAMNGVYGIKLTGPNGNSIFLPYVSVGINYHAAGQKKGTNKLQDVPLYRSSDYDKHLVCKQYAGGLSISNRHEYVDVAMAIRPVFESEEQRQAKAEAEAKAKAEAEAKAKAEAEAKEAEEKARKEAEELKMVHKNVGDAKLEGDLEFSKYLEQNLKYKANSEIRTRVSFIINLDSTIQNVLVSANDPKLENELKRVINEAKWIPSKSGEKTVRSKHKFEIILTRKEVIANELQY